MNPDTAEMPHATPTAMGPAWRFCNTMTGMTIAWIPLPKRRVDMAIASPRSVRFRTTYIRPFRASRSSRPVVDVAIGGSGMPTVNSAASASIEPITVKPTMGPATWITTPASGGPMSCAITKEFASTALTRGQRCCGTSTGSSVRTPLLESGFVRAAMATIATSAHGGRASRYARAAMRTIVPPPIR